MVTDVYQPLAEASGVVLQTVAAFLEHGSSIEATARRLYVHPNTVRYRLKRASSIVGLSPTDPREAHTLRIALTLGRLQGAES
jgi:DNA-binding PucR family transcriptional regulator